MSVFDRPQACGVRVWSFPIIKVKEGFQDSPNLLFSRDRAF
jgi:hypothetical protein